MSFYCKNSQQFNTQIRWFMLFFALICFAAIVSPLLVESAYATSTTIGNTMCRIVGMLTGQVGKAIATMGIVFLAIGLFVGKISWGVAVSVGIGIGAIFGAPSLVNWLAGSTGNASCPTS
jgi:type IV secretory pathway VirB2 component (pilin)